MVEVAKARSIRESKPLTDNAKRHFAGIKHTIHRNHTGSAWVKDNLPMIPQDYRSTFTPQVEIEADMLEELSLRDVEKALVDTIEAAHAQPHVLATLNVTLWVSSFEGDYIKSECVKGSPSSLYTLPFLDYMRFCWLRFCFDPVVAGLEKTLPDHDPEQLTMSVNGWVEASFGISPVEIYAGYMPEEHRDQLRGGVTYDDVIKQTQQARDMLIEAGYEPDPLWDLDYSTKDMGKDYRDVYASL